MLILAFFGLAACSQQAGDFGRQRSDYLTRNVLDPVDRRLMTGGAMEMSKLPLSDEERRMYDVLWRFFSAPYASEWSPFGTSRVSPIRLRSGEAFENTDKYYSWLKSSRFKSSVTRYNAMASHIEADLGTIDPAFAAICAVRTLDDRRRTASGSFPELGEEEQAQVDLRLQENANAIASFTLALDYRYRSYTYALKRLLVETPNEAARTVDAGLSDLATKLDAARGGAFCPSSGRAPIRLEASVAG